MRELLLKEGVPEDKVDEEVAAWEAWIDAKIEELGFGRD